MLSRSLLGTADALGPTEAAGPTQVAPRVAVAPPTATGLSGFYGESQLQLTRRRRKQWIGASVVAAAIVAVGSFLALKGDDRAAKPTAVGSDSRAEAQSRKDPDPRPAPAAAPAPATAPATAPAPVTARSSFRPSISSPSSSSSLGASVVTPRPASARPRAEKRARDVEPATLSVGVVEGDEPSSGVLLVNGKRHGEVPGSFQVTSGKKYRLEIEKKGYRSFPRSVKLKPGEERSVTFKVEPVEQ